MGRHRDPGGGSTQMHDFDVVLPGDRVVAVEVTRHTVSAENASRAETAKREWQFPALGYDWVVDMTVHHDVRHVHREFPALLAEVEAAGLDRFDLKHKTPSGPAAEALQAMRAAGARLLYRHIEAKAGGGRIILGAASVVGSTAADVLTGVTERYGNLADNARKVASAEADERHLFIWVESGQHQATSAMAFEVLPERHPELPERIDAVWLATAYDVSQVWRWSRIGGWEDLGTLRLPLG
ncbi:MAG: hypothetical protein ACRD2W_05435 [Acidimicrobiales bacterium]